MAVEKVIPNDLGKSDPILAKDLGLALQKITDIIKNSIQERQELIKEIAALSAEVAILSKNQDISEAILTRGYQGKDSVLARLASAEVQLKSLEEVNQMVSQLHDLVEAKKVIPEDKVNVTVERLKTIGILIPGVLALLAQLLDHYFK